eukprot:TRINITY_DN3977_c1_g1_i1.p1 TRINITY_DN3977_c1_g1~~TRINITY_DN3977_c1_g1_i1.p1  ORF type:complete len:844 (-),score=195.92 TRINITY_DN3977_c1_g1_i1:83-2614(-)
MTAAASEARMEGGLSSLSSASKTLEDLNLGELRLDTKGKSTLMELKEDKKEKKGESDVHGPKPIFADAAAMKEKMRQAMSKPEYNVANFYKRTGFAPKLATNQYFDKLTLTIIASNALWIAIDTDQNPADVLLEAELPFQLAENLFCAFFTFEIMIRFFAFHNKRDCLKDIWFCFDSLLVVTMILETWVMTMFIVAMGPAGTDGLSGGSLLRVVRLLRLSRMARMARLMRAMPELLILIKGMWAATRSVFFTLLLLVIILYIFGIAFTQIASGTPLGEARFELVGASMHTLLIFGVFMDEVGVLVEDITSQDRVSPPILITMFYIFVLVSAFTVMNMLIGVLCEVVEAVAATEKESASVAYVKVRLKDIMRQGGLDTDGDGMISKTEFVAILDNAQATRILAAAGVDVFGLVDCADFIFHVPDINGEVRERTLDFGDFMEVVLQLRGTNVATVKDIMDLRKFVSVTTKRLDEKLVTLDYLAQVVKRSLNCQNDVATTLVKETKRSVEAHMVKVISSLEASRRSSDNGSTAGVVVEDGAVVSADHPMSLGKAMQHQVHEPRPIATVPAVPAVPMVQQVPAGCIIAAKEVWPEQVMLKPPSLGNAPPAYASAKAMQWGADLEDAPMPPIASEMAPDGTSAEEAAFGAACGGLELRVLSDLAMLRRRIDVELDLMMQRVRDRAEKNLGAAGTAAAAVAHATATDPRLLRTVAEAAAAADARIADALELARMTGSTTAPLSEAGVAGSAATGATFPESSALALGTAAALPGQSSPRAGHATAGAAATNGLWEPVHRLVPLGDPVPAQAPTNGNGLHPAAQQLSQLQVGGSHHAPMQPPSHNLRSTAL